MRTFHRLLRKPCKVAVFLLLSGLFARTCSADAHSRATAQPPPVEPAERALGKWLDALSFAESGNREWIVHRDLDGRLYYGCLQFREKTFRFFVQKYDLAPKVEGSETMDLIYDCEFQKRLAARMIRQNPANWKHWRNTVGRIGLPPGAVVASESPDSMTADPAARRLK